MSAAKPVVMVDDIRVWPGAKGAFRAGSCHLTIDGETVEHLNALHAVAKRIGLKRSSFQPHHRHPHYDLTEAQRDAALAAGAVYVDALVQARARLIRHGIIEPKAVAP